MSGTQSDGKGKANAAITAAEAGITAAIKQRDAAQAHSCKISMDIAEAVEGRNHVQRLEAGDPLFGGISAEAAPKSTLLNDGPLRNLVLAQQ